MSLSDVDDAVLTSEIAVLTGGKDNYGIPLITFPAPGVQKADHFTIGVLLNLLRFYLRLCGGRASFVSDMLHGCTETGIKIIADTLDVLEAQKRGSVAAFYVLKPHSRSKSKLLVKVLGMKPKSGTIQRFKVVPLKKSTDIQGYIHPTQLTTDFGGTLQYNHMAWVDFHKTFIPLSTNSESVLKAIPQVKDKVALLNECETSGLSAEELKQKQEDLKTKFMSLIENSNVSDVVTEIKQALHRLEQPEEDNMLSQIHSDLIAEEIRKLRRSLKSLEDSTQQMEKTWSETEDNLRDMILIQSCKERAAKLTERIQNEYWPQLIHHPYVGNSLSQAEVYRTHFVSSLFEPAKEVLGKATTILSDLKAKMTGRHEWTTSAQDIAKKLSDVVQPFARQLSRLNEAYTKTHVFYVVFEKSERWNQKAMFIIQTAIDRHESNANKGWPGKVTEFLKKHSGPAEDHLKLLDQEIPTFIDPHIKEEARALAKQTRDILRILKNKELRKAQELLKHGLRVIKRYHSVMESQQQRTPSSNDTTKVQTENQGRRSSKSVNLGKTKSNLREREWRALTKENLSSFKDSSVMTNGSKSHFNPNSKRNHYRYKHKSQAKTKELPRSKSERFVSLCYDTDDSEGKKYDLNLGRNACDNSLLLHQIRTSSGNPEKTGYGHEQRNKENQRTRWRSHIHVEEKPSKIKTLQGFKISSSSDEDDTKPVVSDEVQTIASSDGASDKAHRARRSLSSQYRPYVSANNRNTNVLRDRMLGANMSNSTSERSTANVVDTHKVELDISPAEFVSSLRQQLAKSLSDLQHSSDTYTAGTKNYNLPSTESTQHFPLAFSLSGGHDKQQTNQNENVLSSAQNLHVETLKNDGYILSKRQPNASVEWTPVNSIPIHKLYKQFSDDSGCDSYDIPQNFSSVIPASQIKGSHSAPDFYTGKFESSLQSDDVDGDSEESYSQNEEQDDVETNEIFQTANQALQSLNDTISRFKSKFEKTDSFQEEWVESF